LPVFNHKEKLSQRGDEGDFSAHLFVDQLDRVLGHDLRNWVREHLDERQVILMGRVTYEALARFAVSATDEVSARMRALPKLVYSNTLREPLAWNNTQLIKGKWEMRSGY
jgi:hypothetical protein